MILPIEYGHGTNSLNYSFRNRRKGWSLSDQAAEGSLGGVLSHGGGPPIIQSLDYGLKFDTSMVRTGDLP